MKPQLIGTNKLIEPVSNRDHIRGPIGASLTLVEYADYECPWCGRAREFIGPVLDILRDNVRFVFRNFPLSEMHPHAEHAAEAAEAADSQGKFWEMHDRLFDNQEALEDEDLARYAVEIGLDADRVLRDIESGEYIGRIRRDFKSGARSGVNGTPTFFVNGRQYIGPDDPDAIIHALTGGSLQEAPGQREPHEVRSKHERVR
jgi:protein-disulfide isomerase